MGDFGGLEWLVIILVFVLLFGAKRIPEVARGLGKGINEFKKATDDIKREIEYGANNVNDSVNSVKDSVRQIDNDVKDTVNTNLNNQEKPETVSKTSEETDKESN